MRISDWSSDVCSSDLRLPAAVPQPHRRDAVALGARAQPVRHRAADEPRRRRDRARDRLPRDGRLHDRHRRRRASRCAESGVRLMAEEATHRAIMLADLTDAPLYIVHMSAKQAVEQVAWARDKGKNVFGETCPQYLY